MVKEKGIIRPDNTSYDHKKARKPGVNAFRYLISALRTFYYLVG